jgi:hypothetical protein
VTRPHLSYSAIEVSRTAVTSAELAFVHLGHLWFHLGDLFVIISLKE